jgi:hypothetical protein
MISQQLPSHAYNVAGQNIPKARVFVWGMTELRIGEIPNYSAGTFSRSSSRTKSAMLEVSSRFGGESGDGLSCRLQRLISLKIIPYSD